MLGLPSALEPSLNSLSVPLPPSRVALPDVVRTSSSLCATSVAVARATVAWTFSSAGALSSAVRAVFRSAVISQSPARSSAATCRVSGAASLSLPPRRARSSAAARSRTPATRPRARVGGQQCHPAQACRVLLDGQDGALVVLVLTQTISVAGSVPARLSCRGRWPSAVATQSPPLAPVGGGRGRHLPRHVSFGRCRRLDPGSQEESHLRRRSSCLIRDGVVPDGRYRVHDSGGHRPTVTKPRRLRPVACSSAAMAAVSVSVVLFCSKQKCECTS